MEGEWNGGRIALFLTPNCKRNSVILLEVSPTNLCYTSRKAKIVFADRSLEHFVLTLV